MRRLGSVARNTIEWSGDVHDMPNAGDDSDDELEGARPWHASAVEPAQFPFLDRRAKSCHDN